MNKYISKYLFYYPVTALRGEHVLKYYKEYEKFQWMSSGDIKKYQLEHLNKIISHAKKTVTFYRQLYRSVDLDIGALTSVKDICKIPDISKSDIVNNYKAMHSSSYQLFRSNKTTGGSTGQAVTVTKNAVALARERAATWVGYSWAGIGVGDAQGRFWGVPLTRKGRMIYRAIDFISNRYRLSAFNINDNSLDSYYKKLVKLKPAYLYGYVSMIVELARFINKNNRPKIPGLKCVITTSEILDEFSRTEIEYALKVKVFNEYGCGEVGSIAHECEYGNMHIMSCNLIVEIDPGSTGNEQSGELIITDLYNYSMPLIRYRLGDYASLSEEKCLCGRGMEVISKLHGRAYDVIVDPEGNRHHPEIIMYIFEELKTRNAGIKQFQIVQTDIDNLDIKLVVDSSYRNDTEKLIVDLIHSNIHNQMYPVFEYVDAIGRDKSGKLRLIKSELF